jgi:argininosuccinate lyase
MPQKRNPVPFEHVRVLASRAMVEAQGVLGSLHNTPFADMNDAEDDLQPLVYTAFDDAERAVRLLTGALGEAEFDTTRMAEAADRNFLPVTELADTLVRKTGMSFHAAHTIVSRAVRELNGRYDADAMTAIVQRELGGRHTITKEEIRGALSAQNFVAVRTIPGGPAAEALEPEIERARERLAEDQRWLHEVKARLASANEAMQQERGSMLRGMDGR